MYAGIGTCVDRCAASRARGKRTQEDVCIQPPLSPARDPAAVRRTAVTESDAERDAETAARARAEAERDAERARSAEALDEVQVRFEPEKRHNWC